MAVYTEVSDDALRAFLALYEIGEVISKEEEVGELVLVEARGYILTLYEKRVKAEDLPFFIGLMEHLAGGASPVLSQFATAPTWRSASSPAGRRRSSHFSTPYRIRRRTFAIAARLERRWRVDFPRVFNSKMWAI